MILLLPKKCALKDCPGEVVLHRRSRSGFWFALCRSCYELVEKATIDDDEEIVSDDSPALGG